MNSPELAANDALAPRMCLIAFLSCNVSMGCMFGSFGVLMAAVEAKMGITRDLSSLGIPLASLGLGVMSPIAGALAARFSIRWLMITGAAMNLVAYAMLALSSSITIDLVVYALLIGPGIGLAGSVLPMTLVTRWYRVNQGRALGLMNMTLAPAILPLVATVALRDFGLSATYGLLAILMALLILPLFWVVDFPPGTTTDRAARLDHGVDQGASGHGMTIRQLLGRPHFWTLATGWTAVMMSAAVASAHLVPMSRGWGLEPMQAASLLTACSAMAAVGTLTFGWLADRLGYKRAFVLLCADSALLWAVMLWHPSYNLLLLVAGLVGFHGGAAIPVFGVALTRSFGQASFGRAFGLGYVVSMPFSMLSVPIAARVYMRSGSYSDAMIGLIGFLLLATLLIVFSRGVKPLGAAPQ